MNALGARRLVLIGLGAAAGAVLPVCLAAQLPQKPDTIRVPVPPRADSMVKNDSLIQGIVPLPPAPAPRDTIRAPIARAEAPVILEIGVPRIYDRAALYATGAFSLSDMLGRVPGLTQFAAGVAGAPGVVASQGNLRGVRLFLDGLEVDPMDVRSRGVSPVADLPLSTLEELRIERGTEETRVYARTWRVDRTVPYTRADVFTGDLNTNLYRAYFGRRYARGESVQLSAEQFNTQPTNALPSSDGKQILARVGLVRGPWSADASWIRTGRSRGSFVGQGSTDATQDTIPGLETERTTSYLRLGNGDPERGRWFQAIASANRYSLAARTPSTVAFALPSAADSASAAVDSSVFIAQYLLAGGATRGPVRLSATDRIRVGQGLASHVLSARAHAAFGLGELSGYAEGRSRVHPARLEATARVTPLPRIALLVSGSRTGGGTFDRLLGESSLRVFDTTGSFRALPDGTTLFGPGGDTSEVRRFALAPATNVRAEAGMRIRDVWLTVGTLRRGPTTLLGPAELDSSYATAGAVRVEPAATARTAAIRGRLWRAVYADAWAVAWDDTTGSYRPRYQTRAELYVQTSLLNRFPRGNFGLLGSLAHEYRSSVRYPLANEDLRETIGSRTLDLKLEIRIQTAVVSYQFRNLLQQRYQQIPGYTLPRQWQFYGVRWEFWN